MAIAVIGPNADHPRSLLGDYAHPAHVEANIIYSQKREALQQIYTEEKLMADFVTTNSILEAIQRTVSPQTVVHYAQGCDNIGSSKAGIDAAVAAAQQSDVAILVLGGVSGFCGDYTSGEGCDSTHLDLSGVQTALLQAVQGTGTPVVVVLNDGRPLAIPWLAEHIPAIVEAWLPGEEGAQAVADVLFGDFNPGGKLPITFPRNIGQLPVYYAKKHQAFNELGFRDVYKAFEPLYGFGHGLSYTEFQYTNLQVLNSLVPNDGEAEICFDVENIGERSGDEVAQVYLQDVQACVTRPIQQLVGFKRITLEAHQKVKMQLTIPISLLCFSNQRLEKIVEPGMIKVLVGSSAYDVRLTGSFEITGETIEVGKHRAFASRVITSMRVSTP